MARKRTAEPHQVVQAVATGSSYAEASNLFGISRVRVAQIVKEHAPHILEPKEPIVRDAAWVERKALERAELVDVLNSYDLMKDAAQALGITVSGLYSRMRRLGVSFSPT